MKYAISMILCAAMIGCGTDDELESDLAADTSDGTATASSAISIATEAAGSLPAGVTPEAMAAAALTNSGQVLTPAGCAVGQVSGATITWTLTNCTGRHGLVNANGTLVATYSNRTATGFTVRVTGDLTLNRAHHLPDATAVVNTSGDTRRAQVTVNGHGTGPRGVAYQNSGSYTASWDGSCLSIDGSITCSGGGASGTLAFSGWRRCQGRCPDAGGRVSITGPDGNTATIAYNGTATAAATGARGRSYSIPLYCAAQ